MDPDQDRARMMCMNGHGDDPIQSRHQLTITVSPMRAPRPIMVNLATIPAMNLLGTSNLRRAGRQRLLRAQADGNVLADAVKFFPHLTPVLAKYLSSLPARLAGFSFQAPVYSCLDRTSLCRKSASKNQPQH